MTLYAVALLVVGLGAAAVLLAHGDALPPLLGSLVLALNLTLCMNRFVFFPDELAATAEAATFFTAIVAFRSESPVLGPLLLALLVGALDGHHWERRSFLRMSYNSGSQALTVLVAAALFEPIVSATGTLVIGVLVAASLYAALETAFGVVLVVLLGEPVTVAVRQQLPTNALAVPLALCGALIALAVGALGSWWPALLLVPTAFAPELVLIGARRARWLRNVIAVVPLVLLACLLVLDEVPTATRVGSALGIAVLAMFLGTDVRRQRHRSFLPCAALVLATAAGLASAPWLVAAYSGSVVVALLASERPGDSLWSLPLVLTATMVAAVMRPAQVPAGFLAVFGVVTVVAAVATWGSLPWPSRVVGPWGALRGRWFPIAVMITLAVTCGAACLWRLVVATPVAGQAALVSAGAALACATATVRQWRFARNTRVHDAIWLAAAALPLAPFAFADASAAGGTAVAAALITLSIAVIVAVRCAWSVRRAAQLDEVASVG